MLSLLKNKRNLLIMLTIFCFALTSALILIPMTVRADDDEAGMPGMVPEGFDDTPYTGEVLPVFYVRDVLAGVDFYVNKLGFVCHHFYDHINGGSIATWTYDEPPVYAEMRAGDQKFAIHLAANPDSLQVGGTRHYFSVSDVRKHHEIVKKRLPDIGDIIDRPWMVMFRVVDPDGHELFIFTRPPEDEQ